MTENADTYCVGSTSLLRAELGLEKRSWASNSGQTEFWNNWAKGRENAPYLDSSKTSMPEIVALFAIGSNVRFNFPCGVGFR